ncbi:hypothetical protein LSTR_LSTR006984 [Laodelphax striatellus]|uniref:C2H2-type domain-containing protein n=1 Tax=Laodelphax striatellus TaxID=195883 RepID=A0A482WK39_LAOST|nr:hypothetical protein LSTR_LSTR006984 [Laodelphax striatellus]
MNKTAEVVRYFSILSKASTQKALDCYCSLPPQKMSKRVRSTLTITPVTLQPNSATAVPTGDQQIPQQEAGSSASSAANQMPQPSCSSTADEQPQLQQTAATTAAELNREAPEMVLIPVTVCRPQQANPQQPRRRRFKCGLCGERFVTLRVLFEHIQTCTGTGRIAKFKCWRCGHNLKVRVEQVGLRGRE